MALPHDKSVSKFFKDAARRMDHARQKNEVERLEQELRDYLAAPGKIRGQCGLYLTLLGHLSGLAAVDAYARGETGEFTDLLFRTNDLKTLDLRFDHALSASIPDKPDGRPKAFEDSLNAALPFALSLWPLAQTCAEALFFLADKDQRLRTPETRRMSNGTTDAFLIYLFSNALDLPTTYKPEDMLEDCYKALLDDWRTTDESVFQRGMAGAIDFHMRRSEYSTDHTHFEFDHAFEQVFPVELLAVMSLRRRLKLPDFKTGHALVDGPWEVIEGLNRPATYPLLKTLETRFQKDYPTFV